MRVQYYHQEHAEMPHVVKFSGGRSSAMMLMELLRAGQLSSSRGDVVLFNNTSAEHPETYKFVVKCKEYAESNFDIPFFLIEFRTYEDAWLGRWRRASTYRMVKPYPYRSYKSKRSYGYRYKGEVFKDFVSWKSQLPTRFSRTCTEYLKLRTTAHFLEDWFGRIERTSIDDAMPKNDGNRLANQRGFKNSNPRLGHFSDKSLMPDPEFYGARSEKVRYHLQQPTVREPQAYQDFTKVRLNRIRNPLVKQHVFDHKANLRGEYALPFVSLVGLRADEPVRVARVLARNSIPASNDKIADGEIVYAPLFDSAICATEVFEYWRKQPFGLKIPDEVNLSNCVFCFMKGTKALRDLAQNHSVGDGPGNIRWWADFEAQYANCIPTKGKQNSNTVFGFFGANATTYKDIANGKRCSPHEHQSEFMSCECTD